MLTEGTGAGDGPPDGATAAHPMVLAAQARLAREGGWERVLCGAPLRDNDLIDAELLAAAGVLVRLDEDRFRVATDHAGPRDPQHLAAGNIAMLRRALHYAESSGLGWTGEDLAVVRAQGRSSEVVADILAEQMLDMPSVLASFRSGTGRFLDVGVGIAALSIRLCELFPGTEVVGLDVLAEVLDVARQEVLDGGCGHVIDLRRLDVAELGEVDRFDLAWVPQAFVPRPALEAGVDRVLEALRPDGWLVMSLSSPLVEHPFHEALAVHDSHLQGGGPMGRDEAERLVKGAGFVDLSWRDHHGLALLRARRS